MAQTTRQQAFPGAQETEQQLADAIANFNQEVSQLKDSIDALTAQLQQQAAWAGGLGTDGFPLAITEQYKINFRKKLTPTSAPQQQLLREDASILLLETDSVIQWDLIETISADSPQMAGTTTTYDRIVLGVQKQPRPLYLSYQLVLGTSPNLWVVTGA